MLMEGMNTSFNKIMFAVGEITVGEFDAEFSIKLPV